MRPLVMVALVMLAACSPESAGPPLGSEDPTSEATEVPPEPTPTERPTPRPTARPTPEPPDQEELVLVEAGFTYFADRGNVSAAAILENPNPDTWVAERVSVNVTAYDAAGTVVGSQEDIIIAVLPGQRTAVAILLFGVSGAPTEIDVQFRVGDWTEIDFTAGTFEFVNVTTGPRDFGGHVTRGEIASTFESDQNSVRIFAVYRDGAAAILGGEWTFVDFVPAGSQVGFEVTAIDTYPGLVNTEMYAQIGFGD